jgi:RNA polymerase sigma-B factor
MEDLVQVAIVGLLKAVDRYDPTRNVAFAGYAAPVILGELRHHLRDNGQGAHVPRGLQERAAQVAHAARELTAELHRPPRRSELTEHTGLGAEEVAEAIALWDRRKPRSLEAGPGQGSDEPLTLLDRVGSEDERLRLIEYRLTMARGLKALDEQERACLALRVVDGEPYSRIAQTLGITPRRAARLAHRALVKVRAVTGLYPSLVRERRAA